MFIFKDPFYYIPKACDLLRVIRRARSQNCYLIEGRDRAPHVGHNYTTYAGNVGQINMARGTTVMVAEVLDTDGQKLREMEAQIKEQERVVEMLKAQKVDLLNEAYSRGRQLTSEEIAKMVEE